MKGFTKCAAGHYYNYYKEELPLCPPSCPYCQSGNKPEETAKNPANTKEYLRKIRPLSLYICALGILIAFIFGTLSASNFEIPLAVISISLFLYLSISIFCNGATIKNGKWIGKIHYTANPQYFDAIHDGFCDRSVDIYLYGKFGCDYCIYTETSMPEFSFTYNRYCFDFCPYVFAMEN